MLDEDDKIKAVNWLSKPGNNFCAMPFIHMAIEANGDIRPCCMGKEFKDLNIRGKTIEEVYNDPVRLEFIEAFKRNEQHPNCSICWKDPTNNLRTKFSSSGRALDYTTSVIDGLMPKAELRWLEIKPGNRCNLKCRICGVHNSSSWAKDDAAMSWRITDKKFKESWAYRYTQSCDWIDDHKIWNDINQLESIEYIHFMGGEPFMVPEHFQLLERLVESNIDTDKITVIYNTNGTYFPTDKQFELYSKFRKIMFQLSIDDIGKRFEYERNLAYWDEVRKNIQLFKQKEESWQRGSLIQSLLDPTISIYNIFYMNEIEKEFNALGFTLTIFNEHQVVGGPTDCRSLPAEVKDAIVEKYKNSTSVWIRGNIAFLTKNKPTQQFKMFVRHTNKLDELRKEKFSDTFSKYFKLLQPYWKENE